MRDPLRCSHFPQSGIPFVAGGDSPAPRNTCSPLSHTRKSHLRLDWRASWTFRCCLSARWSRRGHCRPGGGKSQALKKQVPRDGSLSFAHRTSKGCWEAHKGPQGEKLSTSLAAQTFQWFSKRARCGWVVADMEVGFLTLALLLAAGLGIHHTGVATLDQPLY